MATMIDFPTGSGDDDACRTEQSHERNETMASHPGFARFLMKRLGDFALPSPSVLAEGWRGNDLSFFGQGVKVASLVGVACAVTMAFFRDFSDALCAGILAAASLFYLMFIAFVAVGSLRKARAEFEAGHRERGETFVLFVAWRSARWFVPSIGILKDGWRKGDLSSYIGQVGRLTIATTVATAMVTAVLYGVSLAPLAGISVGSVVFVAMFYALVITIKIRAMRKEFEESRKDDA